MKIEQYFKTALSEAKIDGQDAAKICGYKYANSYYGKLSKQNLNLHDIIALTAALDKRLCVVPSAMVSYYVAQDDIAPDYLFELSDYLTEEEQMRIYKFREQLSKKLDVNEWVNSLTEEERNTLFANHNPESYRARKEEGFSLLESVNFRQMVEISGKEHKTAYQWLNKVNADAEPHEEVRNWMRIEKTFDVLIMPFDKSYAGLQEHEDSSLKFAVERTNGDDTEILYVTESKEEAYAKAEAISKEDGLVSVVRREFDANNNPVGNKMELLQTWH